MDFTIRAAARADAPAVCDVVRRSITELCHDDHLGDAETLAQWLADKTPDRFERLIDSGRHVARVAVRAGAGAGGAGVGAGDVVGFGALNLDGTISLLYVAPEARWCGVSKALLAELEDEARRAGIRRITLESSRTALRFYDAAGYLPAGDPIPGCGISWGFPRTRRLEDAAESPGETT